MDIERDETGKFAPGNSGGPGRPRRATERAYLLAFSDALTLEDWKAIVGRAVEDAKNGDAKSREWLARYALGAAPSTLAELAALEALGVDEDLLNAGEAKALAYNASPWTVGHLSAIGQALTLQREQAEQAEQVQADEERRQAREARKAKKLLEAGDNGSGASS